MKAGEMGFVQRGWSLLKQGPFRRYVIGSAISDTGTWMQVMAQAWVMSTLTSHALVLSLVNLASGIPAIILTMAGGSAADRHDKRLILVVTQIVQIATAVALGLLVLTGAVQIWHVIMIAAVLGTCIAYEMPAINALVPELVTKDEIGTAIAIDRAVFHGARLVGPSVAGLLVAAWGAAWAFFGNAISFVALIIALLSLPPRAEGTPEEEEQRRSGFKEGWLYVRSDRTILAMIALIALSTVFVFPVISVMLPLYVRNELHLGADSLGWVMAMSAIGSLSGAIGLLSVPRALRFKYMTAAAVVAAISLFSLSRASSFLMTACSMMILAIGISFNWALAATIVQERSPGPLRGRISAIFGFAFFGLMPITGFLLTGLADLIGMRPAIAIGAILYGIGAVTVLSVAGRTVCDKAKDPVPEPTEVAPIA